MTNPYYVSPEQVMKDRADYARKGIARGRSLVAYVMQVSDLLIKKVMLILALMLQLMSWLTHMHNLQVKFLLMR